MKYVYAFFSLMVITALFTNCAGSKGLEEQAPAQIQRAYVVQDNNIMNLYIPVRSIQDERVNLESVYFREMKSDLKLDETQPGVYVARFVTGRGDMVMSSNPKEEYGNRLPQKKVDVPFKLKDDEAILVFSENENTKYYKLRDIKERTK